MSTHALLNVYIESFLGVYVLFNLYIGSYMSVHVLLNLLNKFGKRDKM